MGSTIALAPAAQLETAFLPAGWEIKVVGSAADLDAPAVGAQLIAADETTGEVTAIVGVTGIVDHVGDLITPGAYSETLTKRRPKVCWAHSWEMPIGGVRQIEEWRPGDPRFAEVKATLDGKPWPAEAGALVATMQMNLKSDKGREAFAAVEFYSKTGECEWSIGWQPVPAQTVRRKDGVRVCKKVELYEVSPVLFGAAPLTRTLEVKSLNLQAATPRGIATRVGQPAGDPADEVHLDVTGEPEDLSADPTDEAVLHRTAMEEIDWDEVDAAIDATNPDSAAPAPGTAAVAAGDAPDAADDPETQDEADQAADEDETVPTGSAPFVQKKDGGILLDRKSLDAFTAGLDLTALTGVVLPEVKAEGGADKNRGNAEQLRRWYVHEEGAALIQWGVPGDFMRCVAIAGKHMDTERAKGYCNLRHKDALGVYPGQEHGGEEKSLGVQAAETLAKSWNPLLEVGPLASHGEKKMLMADGVDGLSGSFEQRRERLQRALEPVLKAKIGWKRPEPDTDDKRPHHDDDCWVSIDGTWPDRVVATAVRYGGDRVRKTFMVPYTFDGDEITLGKPQEVELQVSIVPSGGGDPVVPDAAGGEDLEDAMVLPAFALLGDGVTAIKSAMTRTEVKAGRVLSEANASRLRGALEHLLEVARSAGIDLPGWTGPDPDLSADGQLPDTTAQAGGMPAGPHAVATKTLTVESVRADLAQLSEYLP